MPTYTAVLDFPTVLSSPQACPECGGGLDPRPVAGQLVFACADCEQIWRFELGRAVRIGRVPAAPGGAEPCASA